MDLKRFVQCASTRWRELMRWGKLTRLAVGLAVPFVAASCYAQNSPDIKDLYGKSDVLQVVDPQLPGHDFIVPYGIRYMKASTTAPTCEVIDAKKPWLLIWSGQTLVRAITRIAASYRVLCIQK